MRTSNTPETRQRLINQIWALYECQLMVLPTDRQIFHQPLSALLEQPNQTLKTFLQHSKPLIQRSMKLYREQQQRQHRDIASYFIRNPCITRVTQGQ